MKQRNKSRILRLFGLLASAAMLACHYAAPMRAIRALPDTVRAGGVEEKSLFKAAAGSGWITVTNDALPVSARTDERLGGAPGGSVTYRLFGVLPLRSVSVVRESEVYLIPGGASVGITIRTDGVLVVGLGTVDTSQGALSPGSAAGLQAGDVILEVDGERVRNTDHLARLCRGSNGRVRLAIERGGERMEIAVQLVRAAADGSYRIGLWVRDSTAGVGTLSFYDTETGWFAALGHAVSDVDTHSLLSVREGRIVPAQIVSVKKGEPGVPGELIGTFSATGTALGTILVNSEYGIFGTAASPVENPLSQAIPMGYGYEARTGPAKLYTTVDGGGVTAFDCRVVRVNAQSNAASKGMVIEVTDPRLLETTGGVIQGMSGSPLVMDGKLIGVVTHVFVNDPTRGYCIYAEWMRGKILAAAS